MSKSTNIDKQLGRASISTGDAERAGHQTSSLDLSLDDADDVTKQKHRHAHLHTKPRVSLRMKMLQVEHEYPEVWGAIAEVPWELAYPCIEGICLQPKLFMGIKRRGKNYVNQWLIENHISISHKGMLILEAVCFFHEFTTWDNLFAYLETHDWGQLEPDRALGNYPKQTSEESRPVIREKQRIDEVDVIFFGTRNKLSRSEAYKHFFDLGYEIIP
jgi:hypothetical protein